MNMVAHQAPSQNPQLMPVSVFAQNFNVALAAFIGHKNALAIVPALRNVVRNLRDDETRAARHVT
jgi:hypothetical protein